MYGESCRQMNTDVTCWWNWTSKSKSFAKKKKKKRYVHSKHHVNSISHLGWAFQVHACCKIQNGRLIAQRLHLRRWEWEVDGAKRSFSAISLLLSKLALTPDVRSDMRHSCLFCCSGSILLEGANHPNFPYTILTWMQHQFKSCAYIDSFLLLQCPS